MFLLGIFWKLSDVACGLLVFCNSAAVAGSGCGGDCEEWRCSVALNDGPAGAAVSVPPTASSTRC